MQNALQIHDLCKRYPGFQLKNVSFVLPQGSIMGFIGENGAGKTTTIKLILNEIKRSAGSISVLGMDNIQEERKIKEQLGVVFDESYFHQDFKAEDIRRIMRYVYRTWDDALFGRYVEQFALPMKRTIKEYSKGMKMKLSIATALAHRPRLLILDEATSGLDPVTRNEILDIFLDFIQDEGHSILFSSHITGDLERVADYITFIHQGEIIFSREKDALLESYGVLKCGERDYERLDRSDIAVSRKGAFGYEVLVSDRPACRRKYRDLIVDPASLDDMMLLYKNR
jgi:ABC-2 type transport system ATP-binding protein